MESTSIKIGQRWQYVMMLPHLYFIAEVCGEPVYDSWYKWYFVNCVIVQSGDGHYPIGTQHNFRPFPKDTVENAYGWSYLPGQDKPQ